MVLIVYKHVRQHGDCEPRCVCGEFPAPGAPNADFRGPCARHDLCYAGSTDQLVCDNALHKDMYTNCTYYYSSFSVLRPLCKATADIYWAAVVIT